MSAAVATFWRGGRGVGWVALAGAAAVVVPAVLAGVLAVVAPAQAGGC